MQTPSVSFIKLIRDSGGSYTQATKSGFKIHSLKIAMFELLQVQILSVLFKSKERSGYEKPFSTGITNITQKDYLSSGLTKGQNER